MALDFIRANMFDTAQMRPLPYNVPGPDNDLNELLQKYVKRSMAMQSSVIYAFGQRWGPDKGLESVIILNITPRPIDLKGWNLADSEKKKAPLSGILKAGQTMTFSLQGTGIQLPNEGGIITLLDNKGLKVHGVSYTAKDAANEGWTIVF
jgi:hypothetical protein